MHIDQQRKLRSQLREFLSPVAEESTLYISGIEFTSDARGALVRIYIDHLEDQGVGIADCTKLSREFSLLLDVEDPIATSYTLEVSSPGLDRILELPSDFERFTGFHVRVKRVNHKNKLDGVLLSHSPEGITIQTTSEQRFLEFNGIAIIRLHPTDEEIQRLISAGDSL